MEVCNHEPIIQSLLDTDFYKFTMGQLVFQKFRDVPVTFGFKNRTRGIKLAAVINEDELRRELDNVRTLRFTRAELHYLRGTDEYSDRMFREDYLQFLKNLELPPYRLERSGDSYCLEFSGPWAQVIYWETIALSIMNELYYRASERSWSCFEHDRRYATGVVRLAEKINLLKRHPLITFTDFGTRRRFSRVWQDYVVKTVANEFPATQFLGTSNTLLAMRYSLMPMGTSAHELPMVCAALGKENNDAVRRSHGDVLCSWWELYGQGLSIALTDTFGSDFFFSDMTEEQAHAWKGLRHDSGDPYEFTEKAIAFYERHGVDPKTKLIVYSDGLDTGKIVALHKRFHERIRVTFGWGTNLTNDVGHQPLSMVVKAVDVDGWSTVKLSDNLAKAMGESEEVRRYRHIFNHTSAFTEECIY